MDMEKITVEVYWEEKNYCCGWGYEGFGAIVCTNKNLEDLKKEFEQSLSEQAAEMAADDEPIPQWLATGDYEINYELAVSALLRQAEKFTTMAIISRFTGINQKLLSHYANSLKKPREAQRQRIVRGLHEIGKEFLAVH